MTLKNDNQQIRDRDKKQPKAMAVTVVDFSGLKIAFFRFLSRFYRSEIEI